MPEPIPCPNCGQFHAPGECISRQEIPATTDAIKAAFNPEQKEAYRQLVEDLTIWCKLIIPSDLPKEILHDPEVVAAAKTGLIRRLGSFSNHDNFANLIYSFAPLDLPAEFFRDPEILQAAQEGIIYSLKNKRIAHALDIIKALRLNPTDQISITKDLEVLQAVKDEISELLSSTRGYEVERVAGILVALPALKELFIIPEMQQCARYAIGAWVSKNGSRLKSAFWKLSNVCALFSVPEDVAIKEAMIFELSASPPHYESEAKKRRYNSNAAYNLADALELNEGEQAKLILEAGEEAALRLLKNRNIEQVILLHKDFEFDGSLGVKIGVGILYTSGSSQILDTLEQDSSDPIDPFVRKAWDIYNDQSIPLAIRQSNELCEHVLILLRAPEYSAEDISSLVARLTHYLSPQEYASIAKSNPAALALDGKNKVNADALVREIGEYWCTPGEDATMEQMLTMGVQRFGAETMLSYTNRPDTIRHNTLYFMPALLRLQEQSGLVPKQFADNILAQVVKDGTAYANENGSDNAHGYFASICDALQYTSPTQILKKMEQYSNIKELQSLATQLGAGNPMASWKSLKKLYEIHQLLGQTEILEELNAGAVEPRMRAYVEKLAFHPNISTDAVIKFWKDTAAFLDIDDEHTGADINRVKKPANLISLPYLGLRAEDLRDALVNGELDALQALPAFEREYYFGVPNREQARENSALVFHALRSALGERKKGIKGIAANVPKLFSEVQAWCKAQGIAWNDFWNTEKGPGIIATLPEAQQEKLHDLVYDKNIGIRGEQEALQRYRARIGLKSDPDMVVAGNDTASCMPFGSGKNNVYMFNPVYAQMVVERMNEEGKWRTAAQSVMSVDHETSTPTPELMRSYLEQGKHIKDLVKPGDLERLPVVTCDNIEPSKNEEGRRIVNLHDVYQRFFTEYLAQNGEQLGVSREKVAIGTGYTPADLGFREVDNKYIPVAPAGYSDNVHAKCMLIDTGLSEIESRRQGISPLTSRDVVSVAVLEGKAYSDNASLVENLHKMQNNIIGMEIADRHFGRPNLSFIYRDQKGSPRGYVLAYEGVQKEQPFVFIDDLATDRESKMAGGRLIKQFFDAYAEGYGTEARPYLPIFTNARDQTSFPILERHAERLAKEKGLRAKVIEIGTHRRGEDLLHDIVVVIGKTDEELVAQEERMRAALE